MNDQQFGWFVKKTRANMGLRQAELARRMEISGTYLNDVEAGRRPISERFLDDFAAVTGLDRLTVYVCVGKIPVGNRPGSYEMAREFVKAYRSALHGRKEKGESESHESDSDDSLDPEMVDSTSRDDTP